MKIFKKSLAAFLVVLMLLTSAPLQRILGLDINLPDFFSSEANAVGVPGYSAGAAVKWALEHYEDVDSKLTGKGYWSEGGDCANFVSQCVYMGGINMKTKWYSNGYWRVWDPFTWIRAHELYQYMVELGGKSINNPKASDVSIGDLIFYKTRSDGKMHHSAIVVDIKNGVPVICAHSIYNKNTGKYEKYKKDNWTLDYSGNRIYLVKMNGAMCYADNPRKFTVYTAKDGARKNIYSSASTSSTKVGSVMSGSHTFIHVYEEKTVNGVKWGKMQWAGTWAWTQLSGYNKKSQISSYIPTHDFGAWKTIATANCINDGITERVCKRCGYTEKDTTPKKDHVPGDTATCLVAQTCTVCNAVLKDALGHNFEGGLKMPTCTEAASGSYECTRCGISYSISEKWTEYTVPVQEYNGHYYQVFNDAMSWTEAKALCEGLRGHLIVINDEAEQEFMKGLISNAVRDNIWIGLYRDDSSTWKWVNGDPVTYTHWGTGEPSNTVNEYYVHTYSRYYSEAKVVGDWNDMQNSGVGSEGGDYYTPSNYGFICEWDSYEDYPTVWKETNGASIKAEIGYTYKEKETTTSTSSNTLEGWVYDKSVTSYGSWGSWSGWSTTSQTKTDVKDVENRTVYKLFHYCDGSGNTAPSTGYDYGAYGPHYTDLLTSLPSLKDSSVSGYKLAGGQVKCSKGATQYYYKSSSCDIKQYRSRTRSKTITYHFYRWSSEKGYDITANLPADVLSMINDGITNTIYQLGDTKTLYSYRLDALGHQMGEWYTVKVATCLEKGSKRRDCQRCDYYEIEETTAPCVVVKDNAIAPTCKDTGLTEGSHCGVCGKTIIEQQIIPVTEHPFGNWYEVYPISCGKDGLEERVCSFCGFTDQRAIVNPNPDHLGPVTEKVFAPGCEHLHAQGWTEYHCEKCDEQWTDNYTDPLAAVWGEWTVTVQPDCSLNSYKEPAENGERERSCKLCGMIDKEPLLAEHNLIAYDVSSSCTTGGKKGEKCTVCNQIWTDGLDPLGHLLYDDWYTVNEAKCEEPGLERRDCNRNDCEYFETRIIYPINHDYKNIKTVKATCDKQGYIHYVCNNDNSHVFIDYNEPELGHVADNVWVLIKSPTCTEKGEEQCKCIRHDNGLTCNKTYSREIDVDPNAHNWDYGVINPESTCKDHGTKTYTCQNDNSHKKTESVAINPNNHVGATYIKNAKTETCTEDGYTGDKYCSDCNALLEKGKAINKLGHNMGKWSDNKNGTHTRECQRNNCTFTETNNCTFGNWVVTKEATCTAKGSKERVCTVCGYKETAEIELKDHTPGKAVIENRFEPKCEEKGSYDEVVYCTECPKELSRVKKDIAPLGHDWDNGVINPESTCKLHGIKTYTCKNDNSHKKTESIDLNPDNHVGETYIRDAKAETCTEDGYTGDKYCSDCDELLEKGKAVNKLGHDMSKWNDNNNGTHTRECQRDNGCTYTETENCKFSDWVVIKEATCTTKGSKERVCTVCGYKVIEETEMKVHTSGEIVIENEVAPKCEVKGSYDEVVYCTECSKELSRVKKDIPATGHDWDNGVINPESTCKDHGTKTYTCQNDNSHKKTESVALNPNNHVGESYIKNAKTETCTSDGYTGDKYCSDCNALLEKGKTINKLGHDMGKWNDNNNGTHTRECQRDNGCTYTETEKCTFGNWVVTKEATCTAKGSKERVCTVCGYKETATIEIKAHTPGEVVTENRVDPKCEVKGSYDEVVYCTECSKELSRVKKEIPATGHDWDNGVINPESTCKLHGTKTYTCQNDISHKKTESVALNPDNHVGATYIKNAKTETCTVDGYTGDKYCSDCDELLEKGEAIAKLGHDMGKWSDNNNATHTRKCQRNNGCTYSETENCKFSDWVVIKEATCTTKGSKERLCTVCGYKVTEETEMKVHTSGEIVIENEVAPKCEVKGSYDEVVYCTECSKELSRVKKDIPATGHDWDNGVIDPESTCKLHGRKTYTCQNDNSHKKTESVALNPDNHVGETYIRDAKAETCTEDGYTGDKYCSDCDELLEKGEAIAKLGHDWGEWKVSKDATIDAKGEEKRICKRDSSHIETRETDKLVSYTAYFIKANENGTFGYNGKKYDLVDTVRFAKGTTAIVNPDVPEEEGFIGYWEEYTLCNEDIYIEAVYEMKSNDNQSDLISEKDVVYKDGIATITLSAFAETLNAKVPMGATPCDIILVLDQSSSMTSYKIGKETRLAVLKRVAKNFVDTVYESAEENDVDHRIALVSFSGTAENYKGTGLIGTNGSIKTFNKLTDADYASAFIDVNGNHNALKNGIDSLTGVQGTSSDYGLQMARQILANNQDGREKLVLFITDGEPGDPGRNMGAFNYTVANDAIEFANQIKNLYGTTMYSIGVAAGASPSDETNKINKFLHYVSSNYPEAKDMNNKGTAATMKNYFLSAEDAEEIEKMFESIVSRQIVNTISFTKVNFYDTISEYFTLTTENENALREAVKAEYGISDSDIIITRNADGTTTVRINNLVPKAVFNEKNVQIGYGATVKFDVTANEKTLEGGTFVTNTEDAGIENGGKTVIEFKVPDGKEISSGRAIVEFRIGDEVYAIREVSIGDKVVVPETDVADWVVTDGTTITSDYTVFNTEYTTETRTVKWIIDGVTKEETYHIGEIIFAPQINNLDGKLFKGWNAKVPYRMPDYDLEFIAIFETHEHNYKQTAINGECTTGVTYTYTCDCKDSYTKTETYDAHKFTANVQLVNNKSVATMTCTICGKADSKVINYKAQYETNSWWNKTTKVVDLTLYDNAGISIQPDGYIYVKLYEEGDVLSNAKSGKLIVKRVNEDGSEDNIPYLKNSSVDKTGYYVEGNYIVLKLDHFSYYALIMPEDATNVPTYGEIECAFNGHSYTSKVTAPTCKSEGYTTYTCLVCGDSYVSDKTDRTAHKYNKNVTSANCTDKGYTTYVCNVCGHSYKDNYTSALGHSMGAYVVTKQPTCTDKGTETATCSRCTHSETKSVAAKGHNYKNNVCTNCGKSKVENCNHLCHKKGFMGFIWKIVRFFWKLFRMNPICECGAKHY